METHGLVGAGEPRFSIIVPVRNEALTLPATVPSLLAACGGEAAQILYVCNGCTDDSPDVIRRLAGAQAEVIELAQGGKIGALNEGDRRARAFPRFYVDADIVPEPGLFGALTSVLERGEADLVSPAYRFDLAGIGPLSRSVAEIWLALPFSREAAHIGVLGLSRAGRARWGDFPCVMGDDSYIVAMTPQDRRKIVQGTFLVTRPPASLPAWVRTRARWIKGQVELRRMGLTLPSVPGGRAALLKALLDPRTSAKAALFILVRLAAEPVARLDTRAARHWTPERQPAGR